MEQTDLKAKPKPAEAKNYIVFNILSTILSFNIMKFSLLLLLPAVILKAHGTLNHMDEESTKNNYCEVDQRSSCQPDQCIRYESKKFKRSPSVITYFPGGRLGNMLTAFLTLLWIHLDSGLDVFLEKDAHDTLSQYFENINVVPVLEDSLCNWRQFPFKKYEGNVELLSKPEWRVGKAVQIYIAKSNYMRHEIQGGRRFFKQYRKQSLKALTFRKEFKRHAEIALAEVAKTLRKNKNLAKKDKVTFVGVHNRRTDYLEFRKKRLGLENLYEDYFTDAMDYFREEYDNPAFVYVSDDMKWGRHNLKNISDLFFLGCSDFKDPACIGKDLALLAHCNHTITTHGTFGHWASFMAGTEEAGGEIYTEYGAIVPDAYSS